MQLEIPLGPEAFVTLRAGEGPLLQVHLGDMALQLAGKREALLAMRTNVSHGYWGPVRKRKRPLIRPADFAHCSVPAPFYTP